MFTFNFILELQVDTKLTRCVIVICTLDSIFVYVWKLVFKIKATCFWKRISIWTYWYILLSFLSLIILHATTNIYFIGLLSG